MWPYSARFFERRGLNVATVVSDVDDTKFMPKCLAGGRNCGGPDGSARRYFAIKRINRAGFDLLRYLLGLPTECRRRVPDVVVGR
jgi:hypothetical protein